MILLLGGLGKIGRRYQAVLNALEEPFEIYDASKIHERRYEDLLKEASFAIIATPTETHWKYCIDLEKREIPYLCEKPLSKNLVEAKTLSDRGKHGFVVNNWAYLKEVFEPKPSRITYDYFNTGGDGLLWDLCQVIYLAHLHRASLSVRTESYFWDVVWHGSPVPYQEIEETYKKMVLDFLSGQTKNLWSLAQGYEMTQIVRNLDFTMKKGEICEGFDFYPGSFDFKPISRKDF